METVVVLDGPPAHMWEAGAKLKGGGLIKVRGVEKDRVEMKGSPGIIG